MIDKATLDAVLPLPEIEERRDELVAELKEEGFVITNFHSGGIFYTLLMIVLRIEREFKQFLRNFLNNAFVRRATSLRRRRTSTARSSASSFLRRRFSNRGPERLTSSSRPRWRAPGTMSPRARSPGA